MRLRSPTIAVIAAVFVVVPFWSGSAAVVGSVRHNGGVNPTLPVADRTVVPMQWSHHSTPRHYKPVRHKQTQQYYQPARQYYQWHEH